MDEVLVCRKRRAFLCLAGLLLVELDRSGRPSDGEIGEMVLVERGDKGGSSEGDVGDRVVVKCVEERAVRTSMFGKGGDVGLGL